jgi:hypothetical protein
MLSFLWSFAGEKRATRGKKALGGRKRSAGEKRLSQGCKEILIENSCRASGGGAKVA